MPDLDPASPAFVKDSRSRPERTFGMRDDALVGLILGYPSNLRIELRLTANLEHVFYGAFIWGQYL